MFFEKKKEKQNREALLEIFLNPECLCAAGASTPKINVPYSVGSFFSNPRSGSTKWQTSMIGLSFDSVYMKKSYQDNRKFLLRISHVKLLVYWKKIWRWKVAYTCSFLRNQYYLYINCINQKKEFPTQTESILYKTNDYWF